MLLPNFQDKKAFKSFEISKISHIKKLTKRKNDNTSYKFDLFKLYLPIFYSICISFFNYFIKLITNYFSILYFFSIHLYYIEIFKNLNITSKCTLTKHKQCNNIYLHLFSILKLIFQQINLNIELNGISRLIPCFVFCLSWGCVGDQLNDKYTNLFEPDPIFLSSLQSIIMNLIYKVTSSLIPRLRSALRY